MAKHKKPPEAVRGAYSLIPRDVLDSPAYIGATPAARALLIELSRQHTGYNNGRLHLTHVWLSNRGWKSKSLVEKARDELLSRQLIRQTKQGGLNFGPTWFALTWLTISNFQGLDIGPSQYHPGAWMFCQTPPTERRRPPAKAKTARPDHRGSDQAN